jgi:ribosomal protein S18 acetylase RimI-like enzyme
MATSADADVLSAFSMLTYTAAFGEHFRPDDLKAHLQSTLSVARWWEYLARDKVMVAERYGVIVGFLQIEPTHPKGVFFHRLYVATEELGRGIGSMLLRAGLDEPVVTTAPLVLIDVWEGNAGARRLYERFGFVANGERMPEFVTASGEVSSGDLILVRRRAH